jgi:hypothetical protein
MIDGSKRGLMQVKNVRNFLDSVLDEDIHTKRMYPFTSPRQAESGIMKWGRPLRALASRSVM